MLAQDRYAPGGGVYDLSNRWGAGITANFGDQKTLFSMIADTIPELIRIQPESRRDGFVVEFEHVLRAVAETALIVLDRLQIASQDLHGEAP